MMPSISFAGSSDYIDMTAVDDCDVLVIDGDFEPWPGGTYTVSTNAGGTLATLDREALDYAESIATRLDDPWDKAERAAEQWRHWLTLMRNLGAVVGSGLKYWQSRDPAGIRGPQRPQGAPQVIRAGFMSQDRGLAWSRRSRRGRR